MTEHQRLLLIDGHSLAFRAFYALDASKFVTSRGQHTNAVYGFLRMFRTAVADNQPTHLAVAFDLGRATFRNQIFPDYKAQRAATPEEFKGQVEIIREVLTALGVPTFGLSEYEADDILATLATQAVAQGLETVIVTGDRDYIQLVEDQVTVLYPGRSFSDIIRFTPQSVAEKYGVTPAQYPGFAALRGDPSDNLPGVPKVGEKTAAKLLGQYGTLAQLLEHVDEVKGVVGQNLRDHAEQVKLNLQLTMMVRDVPLPKSVTECVISSPNVEKVHELFNQNEFANSLRNALLEQFRPYLAGDATAELEEAVIERTEFTGTLAEYLATYSDERKLVAVSLQGTPNPAAPDVVGIGLCSEDYVTFCVDLGAATPAERKLLAEWFAAANRPKAFHNAKEAAHQLRCLAADPSEISLAGLAHDTLLAAYLLKPGLRSYELKAIVPEWLRRDYETERPKELENVGLLGVYVNRDVLQYDAAIIIELLTVLLPGLEAVAGQSLYETLELPLVPVLAQMEADGIAVDTAALEAQLAQLAAATAQAVARGRELAGNPELNMASPAQLQVVLFETLGLPKTKKTKRGYSTAAAEIEQLEREHPHEFLTQLLTYREHQKLKTTIEGLLKAVAADGRIHTTFNQTAASTGRLSSVEPNLQNIPVRMPAGKEIRAAFVAGGSRKVAGVQVEFPELYTADYSQIEMRVMSHLSADDGLIAAYQQGEDLHNYVGSQVFGVATTEVTPELRRKVKAMSYGLAYGLSSFGLAAQLGISQGEAKKIMDDYFARFGQVKAYLESSVDTARKTGYTATLFGRRRYLDELHSDNRATRENAERAALNAPIQGTAADIIKIAMLQVARDLRQAGLQSRMLLQVHDELVFDVAAGEEEQLAQLVTNAMTHAASLAVPLEVSSGHGPNWNAAAH